MSEVKNLARNFVAVLAALLLINSLGLGFVVIIGAIALAIWYYSAHKEAEEEAEEEEQLQDTLDQLKDYLAGEETPSETPETDSPSEPATSEGTD